VPAAQTPPSVPEILLWPLRRGSASTVVPAALATSVVQTREPVCASARGWRVRSRWLRGDAGPHLLCGRRSVLGRLRSSRAPPACGRPRGATGSAHAPRRAEAPGRSRERVAGSRGARDGGASPAPRGGQAGGEPERRPGPAGAMASPPEHAGPAGRAGWGGGRQARESQGRRSGPQRPGPAEHGGEAQTGPHQPARRTGLRSARTGREGARAARLLRGDAGPHLPVRPALCARLAPLVPRSASLRTPSRSNRLRPR
jgi:hypothetical protein